MKTKFDIADIKSLSASRRKDDEAGIVYDYSIVLEMFPDSVVPIDVDEYMRPSRSFSRRWKRGELIDAEA